MFDLSEISNGSISKGSCKEKILLTNEKSAKYGLILSESDAHMLTNENRELLDVQERVEFGESVTVKIIEKFMQSSYISQEDYAQTIAALLDVFYEAKEESYDLISDDVIINMMYDYFENQSGGSIEVLQTRDMDYFCKKVKFVASGIIDEEE